MCDQFHPNECMQTVKILFRDIFQSRKLIPYRTVLVGIAGILRTGTETPSKCTAQDTCLYRTIPAVPEYTRRFG